MRFTLSSTALSSRLSALARVISNKSSLAILECFLFEVKGGKLYITASDSENVMTTMMPLDETDGDGSFCASSRTILDSVRELPEQPLVFNVDLNNFTIEVIYQNGVYKFTSLNADEFPRISPMTTYSAELSIEPSQLNAAITRSVFATGQDELRPVMGGVLFDLNQDGLSIVATDGHKLVRNQLLAIKNDTPTSFILPKKPASLLKGILGKDGENVIIRFDSRNAEIKWADSTLSCRLIEGRYPNYNAVIPTNNPNQITVDRKALLSVLRRVLPFASESTQIIRFRTEMGKLELSSEDIDFSTSAKETLTCDYSGQPMSIGFKGQNFAEILNNLESNEVVIELADPSRAGVVVPAEQAENENVLMLIMPALLNN
ncbi:MAG: DNA polymerase III subunit beta [Prevotella sp.]|nr:DNA polymerase III subunit beta [Prevotella sp.]